PCGAIPEPNFTSIQVPAQVEYSHHRNDLAPQTPVNPKLELVLVPLGELILAGTRSILGLRYIKLRLEEWSRNAPTVYSERKHQVGVQEHLLVGQIEIQAVAGRTPTGGFLFLTINREFLERAQAKVLDERLCELFWR